MTKKQTRLHNHVTKTYDNRRPEIYVGPRISKIVFDHDYDGLCADDKLSRTPETNFRIASDGFVEVTKEIIETGESMKNTDYRVAKNAVKKQ